MTDQELIKRLRRMSPRLDMLDCEYVLTSADRIEELVKERDDYLAERNKFQLYLQRTHADWELEVTAVDALNAKLAKAVEALREISSEALVPVHTWKNGINFKKMYERWRALAVKRINVARSVLAELEGK